MQKYIQPGVRQVEYPSKLRALVKNAAQSWEAFCALPEEERVKFPYQNGLGYELQKNPNPKPGQDHKADFHYSLARHDELLEIARAQELVEAAILIGNSQYIIENLVPTMEHYCNSVEKEIGITGVTERLLENRDNWILRYLHYYGDRSVGDEIASPHVDKAFATPHLHMSESGFQILGLDGKWKHLDVFEDETTIIPGIQAQYFAGKHGKILHGIPHRVIANAKSARIGRISMVLFATLPGEPGWDKKKGGRLQDKVPGFNREIPFDTLKEWFS